MGHGDYSPTSRHQESQPEHTGNEDTPCAITWLLLGCHTGSSAFPNRPFSLATSNWTPTLAAIDYDGHANILREHTRQLVERNHRGFVIISYYANPVIALSWNLYLVICGDVREKCSCSLCPQSNRRGRHLRLVWTAGDPVRGNDCDVEILVEHFD